MTRARLVLGFTLLASATSGCRSHSGPDVSISAETLTPTSSAPTAEPNDAMVTFKVVPATVGEKETTTVKTSSELELRVAGKAVTIDEEEESERVMEVLAISGSVASKSKVTYTRYKTTNKMSGKDKPNGVELAGKSFVVERTRDALIITDLGGAAVSKEEQAILSKEMRHFGQPDETAAAVAAKPRKVGDSLDDLVEVIKRKWREDVGDGGAVEDCQIKFVSIDHVDGHDVGTFDVALTMRLTKQQPKMEMKVPLKGTFKLRVDSSELGEVNLSGPATISGDIKGTGNMTLMERSTE